MPEISHELSEVAWCAFRDSNKPAPYNQIRDALEAYEVAKNESAEAAITKALERLEAIASYQPRPNMKRELRELAEIFRLGLAKPKPSPAGGVREMLEAAYEFLGGVDGASDIRDKLLAAPSSPAIADPIRGSE